MDIFEICKSASHGCISVAIVGLLLASPAALRADNKNENSAQTTPATNTKSSSGSNRGKHNSGESSGAQTPRHSARTNTTGRSGGTQTTGNTGGANATGSSGATHRDRKTAGATTINTGGASATGSTTGTSSTGASDQTRKERKRAGGTSGNTGETSSSGNTGGTNTAGKPGKNITRNTTGTSSTSNTAGTNTTGNPGGTRAARKGEKASAAAGSGNTTIATPGIVRGTNGKVEVYRGHNGSEARFRRDGSVREVHARDMTIIHLPGGSRRIVVERVDHSRIVAYRGGYGYVQRPFVYRGHEFATRTYIYGGRPYAVYYQRYPYRGVFLEGYRPYRYYGPAFYGWAYNPWRSPVRYSWGWVGNPWYGYYGGYFTPYPVYPSASFWLTDYFIAASLQAAYQQRADYFAYAAANSGGPVVLTPEIKQAIADEVQSQLALESSESQAAARGGDVDINSSGLPRILAEASPNHPRIFVVAGPLEVTDAGGQECGLTAGDVLRLSAPPPPDATSVYLQVFASKNQECPRGTTVSVGLADLQEMQNSMRASIDQGLQELQSNRGGLPAPPSSAVGPPVQAPFAPIAPPPDPNVTNELQQQGREADTAEQGVLDEVKRADTSGSVGDSTNPAKAPVEISLGQTMEEVVAALGNPRRIVNLGAKKIYIYSDMKITFTNGKVTNVE